MDNLKPFALLFILADGSFFLGLCKGLGLPLNIEGWGVAGGAVLFYLLSQFIQGRFNARRWRRLRRELLLDLASHLEANRKPVAHAAAA